MMRQLLRFSRGILSLTFFLLFGVGGLFLSLILHLPLYRNRARGIALVSWAWRILIRLFLLTRIIRITHQGERELSGRILVANHPSLIDVVILTTLYPNTLSVAKHDLRRNWFMGGIVRRVFLPDNEALLEKAPEILAQGLNILIFPEGTRSPAPDRLRTFYRGAAQLAIRTRAPIVPIAIAMDYCMLTKGQSPADVGERPVHYTITTCAPHQPKIDPERSPHKVAKALTADLRQTITNLVVRRIER